MIGFPAGAIAMWNSTALLAGLLLLYLGAEWLVKGAAGLGRSFGIRPVVIGLTVVAYGTSLPEFVVSSLAAMDGMSNLALGNVIGSNLVNLGLILGVTAVIAPLAVEGSLIRREAPMMLAVSLVLPVLLWDGVVSRIEGLVLLLLAVAFTWMTLRSTGADPEQGQADKTLESDAEAAGAPAGTGRLRLAGIAVVGLVLLLLGGQAFVSGASGLALAFGLSQRIVGLTIAAVGTSTPEQAASIVAALRGHSSIAVGNVIGSNIFNVLFVLGGVAAIRPVTGSLEAFGFDLASLAVISLLGLLLVRGTRLIRRSEGIVMIACYLVYLAVLIGG
jgi:cation:H+ antiporter